MEATMKNRHELRMNVFDEQQRASVVRERKSVQARVKKGIFHNVLKKYIYTAMSILLQMYGCKKNVLKHDCYILKRSSFPFTISYIFFGDDDIYVAYNICIFYACTYIAEEEAAAHNKI